MRMVLNPNSLDDYRLFVKAKGLPRFKCIGHEITVPDEYAHLLGCEVVKEKEEKPYKPIRGLFDYQRDISRLAIHKKKFAVFAEMGRGKTLIMLEYARHVSQLLPSRERVLLIAPLMVVKQTLKMRDEWYGDSLPIERIEAKNLTAWNSGTRGEHRIGITNYDSLTDETPQGVIGSLIPDEIMKSFYGKWAQTLIRLGTGLNWKMALTGTPAPNDRIEFAQHAVFLDVFPTINSFLAKYFVNRGQTDNRWEIKPHALGSFYRDLSDWCIFLTNPATYGWKDGCEPLPPINIHVHDLELTGEQREAVYNLTGRLFLDSAGGFTKRTTLSRLSRGDNNGKKMDSLKPKFIKNLIDSWSDKESTILWCQFNKEQEDMIRLFPDAVSITGSTPYEEREEIIDAFKAGDKRILISKDSILGFGLNLQIATRQLFASIHDSYERFIQAIKRSNRIGSKLPLNVHLPVTELDRARVDNVLRKAGRVQRDTDEQERIFKEKGLLRWNF